MKRKWKWVGGCAKEERGRAGGSSGVKNLDGDAEKEKSNRERGQEKVGGSWRGLRGLVADCKKTTGTHPAVCKVTFFQIPPRGWHLCFEVKYLSNYLHKGGYVFTLVKWYVDLFVFYVSKITQKQLNWFPRNFMDGWCTGQRRTAGFYFFTSFNIARLVWWLKMFTVFPRICSWILIKKTSGTLRVHWCVWILVHCWLNLKG